jgi:hypothetical protein
MAYNEIEKYLGKNCTGIVLLFVMNDYENDKDFLHLKKRRIRYELWEKFNTRSCDRCTSIVSHPFVLSSFEKQKFKELWNKLKIDDGSSSILCFSCKK